MIFAVWRSAVKGKNPDAMIPVPAAVVNQVLY